MPLTKQRLSPRNTYLELINLLPLRPIKNDREHDRAATLVSELIGRKLDSGANDYLDTLIILVNKYEDQHHAIDETMSPQHALRALMTMNELNQAEMGRIIGSESGVSMFLSGKRQLSKAQIKRLAERFKLDATTFMA